MTTIVKAVFTIINDDEKAKRTEVIEMVYPMGEDDNFIKALLEYLNSEEEYKESSIITG
jgi:hypothetical protein